MSEQKPPVYKVGGMEWSPAKGFLEGYRNVYHCPIGHNRYFTTSFTYRRHMRKHHPEEWSKLNSNQFNK